MKIKIALATCIGLAGVAVLGTLGIVYAGIVDVSATGKEPAPLRWLLVTTREHSIERRAAEIDVPPLGSPAQLDEGLEHYQAMCAGCHAAPGRERGEAAEGLNPRPPRLDRAQDDHDSPATAFWVVRNGIRMTGMPAFGPTHDDDTIWSIVALLEALPDMTPESYSARLESLGISADGETSHHGAHEPGHHDEDAGHEHQH